jgi:hypothetical protein
MAKILVVATTTLGSGRLRAVVPELRDADEVHVVSPASRVSRLQWLANDEDRAREDAERLAVATADAVDRAAEVEADADVGDVDPLQAAEDALARFSADEIVVLVRPQEESTWLERAAVADGFERFGKPVRYVVVRDAG